MGRACGRPLGGRSESRQTEYGMSSGKRILFVHQNFPGQFKFLAPALVQAGHVVHAMTIQGQGEEVWHGVHLHPYRPHRGSSPAIHPWVVDFETKTIRAEAAFRAALALKAKGLEPDVIIAHPGWGESLFLKQVWPAAKLGIFCELYYNALGADVGFDPEFPPADVADACRVQLKNLNYLMHMELADAAIAPTAWQASVYPDRFRPRITVVHDGIDTQAVRPDPHMSLRLNQQGRAIELSRHDPVVTFVNRNLEPYRGYHVFVRALPQLLRRNPRVRVLLVGAEGVSYGARPPEGASWKEIFWNEVKPLMNELELQRVHFLGQLPYEQFLAVLKLSTVHVYLTYPFVLSWSLIEAMSAGCAIVGSDTAPVREVIEDGVNGRLVNFFDTQGLVDRVSDLLSDPLQRERLGASARQVAVDRYDLRSVCLPQQMAWVQRLMGDG